MEKCEGEGQSVRPKLPVKKKRVRKSLSEEARKAKRESDRLRAKNRVNLGRAHGVWKKLRQEEGFKTDAEMALFLINVYLQTKSLSQPDSLTLYRRSSAENRDSVEYEYELAMSSPSDDEFEVSAAPSVESSENGQESENTDHQLKAEDSKAHLSGNKDVDKNKDEGVNSSFLVGDGHHLVDLGSPSEFVVDEECILQLFKSCRGCNKQCKIRKQVKGLKLVINQACCYCEHRFKWTNLPDDHDHDALQVNGDKTAHGAIGSELQTNS